MNDIMTFYLIVAISLLALAIVVYPTLRDKERAKNHKS